MTAAFIHDHNFVYNEKDKLYYDGSGGVFDQKLWQRYLDVFQKLHVVGREAKRLPNKLILSSTENVEFNLIDDLVTAKDRILKADKIKRKLTAVISAVDFVIIRVPSVLGYFAVDLCKNLNKGYVLEVVGCPFDAYWNYGGIVAKIIAPLESYKLKTVVKNSKAVVYVTKDFLQTRYPTKGKSIGISNVNLDEVIPIEQVLDFYSQYTPDEVFNVGMIGSFHVKYKGHVEALNALKTIVEKGAIKKIKLFLVGTGDPEWILDLVRKNGISDYVEIVGTLSSGKDGILPFLDKMHLYIHPSKTEGLPRVVIEALSRGRLCIASSVAGTPELLSTRFLHLPGEAGELSDRIIELYNDLEKWPNIIKENLQKSTEYLEEYLQRNRKQFISSQIEKEKEIKDVRIKDSV